MSEHDDLRRLAAGKFGVSITSARLLEVLDALEAAEVRLAAVREAVDRTHRHGEWKTRQAVLAALEGSPEPHNRPLSDKQAESDHLGVRP